MKYPKVANILFLNFFNNNRSIQYMEIAVIPLDSNESSVESVKYASYCISLFSTFSVIILKRADLLKHSD